MLEEDGEETPKTGQRGGFLHELQTAGLGKLFPAASPISTRHSYFRRRLMKQKGNSTASDRPKLRDIPQNNWPVFIKNITKDKERLRSSSRLKKTKVMLTEGNKRSWIFCYYKEHYRDNWGPE